MNALKVLFKLFLLFMFTVLALFCVLVAYSSYKKVNDLKTWQQLSATVVSSSVEQENRSKGTTYCPSVMVEYVFQGQPQTSKLDIEDGPCSPAKSSVERTLEQYGKGAVVTAFANPQKPSAVRVANYTLGTNFYLMLLLAISLFAGVVYIWRTPANKLVNRDAKKAVLS